MAIFDRLIRTATLKNSLAKVLIRNKFQPVYGGFEIPHFKTALVLDEPDLGALHKCITDGNDCGYYQNHDQNIFFHIHQNVKPELSNRLIVVRRMNFQK